MRKKYGYAYKKFAYTYRHVARDLKKGRGYFETMRLPQAILSRILIVSTHKFPNFKRFFGLKTGDLQKKKKKVFVKFGTNFLAEIGNSNTFSAQKQVIFKKKRFSPNLERIFWPKSEIQTLFQIESRIFGTQISLGGPVFNFSAKFGLKSTKNVRF